MGTSLFLPIMINLYRRRSSCSGFFLDLFLYFRLLCRDLRCLLLSKRLSYLQELSRLKSNSMLL